MKMPLGLLTLLLLALAFSPLANAQDAPTPRQEPEAAPEALHKGHPEVRNDRRPESFYGGNHNMGTHSVMRCKDGTMYKARTDACRGHDHAPK